MKTKREVGPDQVFAFAFPSNGLQLSFVFDQQPQGTTPVGENVRFFESLTERGRGGSRAGISKWIPSAILTYAETPQGIIDQAAVDAAQAVVDELEEEEGGGGGPPGT